jgi:hypothetical protein
MSDGIIGSWRCFYNEDGTPDTELNRWITIYPDGRMRYFSGSDAFTYKVTRKFKSPSTGIEHPVEGILSCPLGDLYCIPFTDNQEAQTLNGAGLWEGAKRFYKSSIKPAEGTKPDGVGFVEHGWAPNPPGGMDLEFDPNMPRKMDGGFPKLDNAMSFLKLD